LAVRFSLPVEARGYPEDHLRVRPELADPPPPKRYRVLAEASTRDLATLAGVPLPPRAFQRPLLGPITSPFGVERILNGKPRGPHLGVDLRAAAGTPVAALAEGRVVLVSREYLGGLTVRVDHGDGWVSHSMHLSAASVRPGQAVEAGATLGRVGATGRVTGPHLHLALSWRGRFVDPAGLVPLASGEGES
jgi:murein DD-endopeptidase MepM/ murein hydrolase activator NlpD